jgi:transposase
MLILFSTCGQPFGTKRPIILTICKAGLTLPISNGQVEGQVTKIKLIKRMMYGRAEFPLLRQRVLHAL